MTKIADKVREAEADYKKKGMRRVKERIEEQRILKLKNQKKQKARASKALRRKIAKARAKT